MKKTALTIGYFTGGAFLLLLIFILCSCSPIKVEMHQAMHTKESHLYYKYGKPSRIRNDKNGGRLIEFSYTDTTSAGKQYSQIRTFYVDKGKVVNWKFRQLPGDLKSYNY